MYRKGYRLLRSGRIERKDPEIYNFIWRVINSKSAGMVKAFFFRNGNKITITLEKSNKRFHPIDDNSPNESEGPAYFVPNPKGKVCPKCKGTGKI